MTQRDFFSYCTSLRLIELKAIGALSQVRHLEQNDLIYSAGSEAENLFIINRGAVELVPKTTRLGIPATLLSRGDIFGEMGALVSHVRDHSARARAAVSVQCFRRDDFPELLRRVPSFFLFLSEKLASRLFQATELARSQNNSLELTGSLANFDVVTVYQTIMQSRQTGLLKIADHHGNTISEFYFEKGTPRWGRFDHLVGEEAFWELFLHNRTGESFSFSEVTPAQSTGPEGSTLTRKPDEALITAIHMRDQLDDVRRRLRDDSVTLLRKKLNLTWDNPEMADLRPAAETVWQLAYSRQISLGDLYRECTFCELKIYRAVDEMVRTGLLALGVLAPKGMLVAN